MTDDGQRAPAGGEIDRLGTVAQIAYWTDAGADYATDWDDITDDGKRAWRACAAAVRDAAMADNSVRQVARAVVEAFDAWVHDELATEDPATFDECERRVEALRDALGDGERAVGGPTVAET